MIKIISFEPSSDMLFSQIIESDCGYINTDANVVTEKKYEWHIAFR